MRMLFLLAAALAPSTLPAPAAAQTSGSDRMIVADCGDRGCRCSYSKISTEDMLVVLDIADPGTIEDKIIILSEAGAVLTTTSKEDADLAAGGDGKCDIELFDPIVPRDGQWVGKVRAESIVGCPPNVAEMVQPAIAAMRFSDRIAWQGAFDPVKLVHANGGHLVSWQERTPESFAGVLDTGPANGVLDVSGRYVSTLVNPDRVVTTLNFRIGSAEGGNAAALAMLGMADCRTHAVYEYDRVGD
jgi:hypothetical protein